ncbi:MAG: hypothetical protein JW750_01320 [Anaerolineaceae bacterium]|nr:hypothetical protein [Anaerolineaceae bacterium]
MNQEQKQSPLKKIPEYYTIKVFGQVDAEWLTAYGDYHVQNDGIYSTIDGRFSDQSALLGLMRLLSGRGFSLVSIVPNWETGTGRQSEN